MEKDLGIKNKVDLYRRLTPALNCKIRELAKYHIKTRKEDIWNYLVKKRWNNVKGLELSEMVDDILNLDNYDLESFLKTQQATKSNNEEKHEEQEIELL